MSASTRRERLPVAARRRDPASSNGMLYPLDVVYTRAGLAKPKVKRISPDEIPARYRSLLVHENDMTVTLERRYGGAIALRPLSTFSARGSYFRRVLLVQESSGRPVEMGAIRIQLAALPPRVRAEILRNEVPLGRLLRRRGVDFMSRPKAFFTITPNDEMMGVFWMRAPRTLYGRRTEVFHHGAKIGDIVEVLPPNVIREASG